MKIRYLMVLLFLACIGGCAHVSIGESWKQSVSERNEMYCYVREEIIHPSVFSFKSTVDVSFKDVSKERPLFAINASCRNPGIGEAFVVNETGDLLTVKHNLHNKLKECEKAIAEEISDKGLPFSFKDLSIVPSFFIIGPDEKEYAVEIVRESMVKDLAVVRVKDKKELVLKPLFLSEKTGVMDEDIVIVGSPFGMENMAVYGHVANDSLVRGGVLFEASVYPGNSGGPLISLSETKALGIVTNAILGGNGQILNFGVAIPSWEIKKFLDETITK